MRPGDQEWDDHVRVRGYVAAMSRAATIEMRTLEVDVDKMVKLRLAIDERQERILWLLEQAEIAATVIASGDQAQIAEVASHLADCFEAGA